MQILQSAGTDITSNMIYVYEDDSDESTKTEARSNIFPLVNNSLRGFRLDRKTYAEDYALSSNGMEVRVTFSDSIDAQLSATDFEVMSADAIGISSVSHNANENKAVITFDKVPPAGSILRFAANAANIMSNSMPLASGNFIASLDYDADAPKVTSTGAIDAITMDSRVSDRSTWTINFSHQLDSTTVDKDNLCLTETPGICPKVSLTSASIQSVTYESNKTTATVVVNENSPGNKILTIAFERNAVRGADQRIVEEDQIALRNAIELAIGAKIEVAAVDSSGDPLTSDLEPTDGDYVMYFKVTANKNVPTLYRANSYQLKGITGSTLSDINAIPEIEAVSGMSTQRAVTLKYTVPVSVSVDSFTVARSSVPTSLLDTGGGVAVRDDAGADVININTLIDNAAVDSVVDAAKATRDKMQPEITVGRSGY